jgi:tetratricopeptide (TPR) repeat protein
MDGNTSAAAAACQQALEIDPHLVPARNNQGLVSATRGDLGAAEAAFSECGSQATAQYNLGIVYLSLQRYCAAAEAFDRAAALDPTLSRAMIRAAQARRRAADDAVCGEGNHERR